MEVCPPGVMDWTLCDPYCVQDVIEEDALSEKACIQVLRLLIQKADNEIVELEEDLVILQSQIAWCDEGWSDLCSTALKEKIDFLDISVRNLKTKNVQDDLDLEPAEKMHDILQPLLRNYLKQKDKQFVDDVLLERKQLRKAPSNTIGRVEAKDTNIISAEKHATSVTSLKPPGKIAKYLGTAKYAGVIANSSNLDFSGAEANLIKAMSKESSSIIPVIFQAAVTTSLNSTPGAFRKAIADANVKLKQSNKGLKIDAHEISSSSSCLKKEKEIVPPPFVIKEERQELCPTHSERAAAPEDLLSELMKHGKEKKSETKKNQSSQQRKALVVAVTDNNKSNPQAKHKRQLNFGMGGKNVRFSQSANEKTEKKKKKDPEAEEYVYDTEDDDNLSLLSLMQKRMKVRSSSLLFGGNSEKMHSMDTTSTGKEDLQLTEWGPDNVNLSAAGLSNISDLKFMTVKQLQDIARHYKMRGYSKFRKAELAYQLRVYIRGTSN